MPPPSPPSSSVPSVVAVRLGYLALVPFIGGAALVWIVGDDLRTAAAQALSAYAAVVVSFIGGIHWGFGFRQPAPRARLFVWGVVPSLVACFAVLSLPRIGLPIHAAMLVACWLVDRATYPQEGAAAWLPLRARLTVVAAACCALGALHG